VATPSRVEVKYYSFDNSGQPAIYSGSRSNRNKIMIQIPLILVSNRTKTNAPDTLIQAASHPRQDYIEIARLLGGKLSGYDVSEANWYPWIRRIERYLKLDLVEALFAARQLPNHNVLLSTSEKIAIPLAVLSRVTGQKIPHVVIGHKLSSGLKSPLLRTGKLGQAFSHIICVCQAQADYAINQLRLPASTVDFVYDKVDHHFFYPFKVDTDNYILAVGQEQRDYETLAQAVVGTGIRLIIVASSLWSTSQKHIPEAQEVTILSHIPYHELRCLYARARLVVVPLFDVDYAAGVNSALEGMAMGKTVLVSHTRGISDYVIDNETGIYVSPLNPTELRNAILSLWEQPAELKRLGANARQAVEENMNLDIYIDKVVEIVRNVIPA
jgi:glycosyltransferase involved in cell wall biosynthesis